ncbi:MAG: DsrE/DsrF/DrsH-like family protein [Proteobacteria bacterium]|nr:DsrE/DsrF/DrsH-like family protein [Pseudomonadota bacterium]MDA1022004.1 DsrE/DsrF/DrsH-like family protein [Pseudomonadota bacterium]
MTDSNTSPDKLSIIVYDGHFDKVHYALVMASAAASIGRPVTFFFTMGACRVLAKAGDDGEAAWRSLPLSAGVGEAGQSGGELDDSFAGQGIATFEELLEACVLLEAKFMICEMGLQAVGMKGVALRDDIPLEPGGVVTFLKDASKDGALIFI